MSEDNPRYLTPTEMSKLPRCTFSIFALCQKKEPTKGEYCVKCRILMLFDSLREKDIAGATESLDSLVLILRVGGVLKLDGRKEQGKEE